MSELLMRSYRGLAIAHIEPGSLAEEIGLRTGDVLLSINGKRVMDTLDYRFHVTEPHVHLTIQRGDQTLTFAVEKEPYDLLDIEFENDLADKIHTCNNKCVFCFIHQMPKGMRRSLYLMDDDFRLSFLYGNYVTLTNLTPEEFERILEQKLSPMYVSVHATDPELRGRLLGKREPTPILPVLRRLHEGGIDVHAQIVLCPGWNDGDALRQTLYELAMLHPVITGKRAGTLSVAIVPVGLTKFRQKLTPLIPPNRAYAQQLIREVRSLERDFRKRLGTRFAFLSDEWFFLAGHPIPGRRYYEDFPQLEDGVGTVRLFLDRAAGVVRRLPPALPHPVQITLVTGELPAAVMERFARMLRRVQGLEINVCVVKNHFFGGTVSVAGLLTAQDIAEALQHFPTYPTVILPAICLREGYLFLDDVTVPEWESQIGRRVVVVDPHPSALWSAIRHLAQQGGTS
ncbi:MAG: radical SAM protein [Armatimonadota bacterium]|nr:MAG: radical SAM protein [Armatimonadota bacterium]